MDTKWFQEVSDCLPAGRSQYEYVKGRCALQQLGYVAADGLSNGTLKETRLRRGPMKHCNGCNRQCGSDMPAAPCRNDGWYRLGCKEMRYA